MHFFLRPYSLFSKLLQTPTPHSLWLRSRAQYKQHKCSPKEKKRKHSLGNRLYNAEKDILCHSHLSGVRCESGYHTTAQLLGTQDEGRINSLEARSFVRVIERDRGREGKKRRKESKPFGAAKNPALIPVRFVIRYFDWLWRFHILGPDPRTRTESRWLIWMEKNINIYEWMVFCSLDWITAR